MDWLVITLAQLKGGRHPGRALSLTWDFSFAIDQSSSSLILFNLWSCYRRNETAGSMCLFPHFERYHFSPQSHRFSLFPENLINLLHAKFILLFSCLLCKLIWSFRFTLFLAVGIGLVLFYPGYSSPFHIAISFTIFGNQNFVFAPLTV